MSQVDGQGFRLQCGEVKRVSILALSGIMIAATLFFLIALQQDVGNPVAKQMLIERHLPGLEGCGRWQKSYKTFHRDVLAGTLPPRYLVYVQVQAGLADQITGAITTFLWALLTKRAIQITTGHQSLPLFESAFDAPHINWTRKTDALEKTEHLYYSYQVNVTTARKCQCAKFFRHKIIKINT